MISSPSAVEKIISSDIYAQNIANLQSEFRTIGLVLRLARHRQLAAVLERVAQPSLDEQ